MQKVTERHDDEHAAEANQGVTCPQTEDYKRAADELDEWNNYSNCPKRPDRQKRIAERQKIFSRMFEWSQLKDLHHPGHEKDETKNQTSKEKSEGALKIAVHNCANCAGSRPEKRAGKCALLLCVKKIGLAEKTRMFSGLSTLSDDRRRIVRTD